MWRHYIHYEAVSGHPYVLDPHFFCKKPLGIQRRLRVAEYVIMLEKLCASVQVELVI